MIILSDITEIDELKSLIKTERLDNNILRILRFTSIMLACISFQV